MSEEKLLLTNIQRMCFHDGPGIRTTVFLKGCNLHCPWCSNPENMVLEKTGLEKAYDVEQLVKELRKDEFFWRDSGGGVTFSGGEPFLQSASLRKAIDLLKEYDVHTMIETALFVSRTALEQVVEVIDGLIVDVKLLEEARCREILGSNLDVFRENIRLAYEMGKIDRFRIPCCKEYTFRRSNMEKIIDFIGKYKDIPIEIFSVHKLAENKYQRLGIIQPSYHGVSMEELEWFQEKLLSAAIKAEIIQI